MQVRIQGTGRNLPPGEHSVRFVEVDPDGVVVFKLVRDDDDPQAELRQREWGPLVEPPDELFWRRNTYGEVPNIYDPGRLLMQAEDEGVPLEQVDYYPPEKPLGQFTPTELGELQAAMALEEQRRRLLTERFGYEPPNGSIISVVRRPVYEGTAVDEYIMHRRGDSWAFISTMGQKIMTWDEVVLWLGQKPHVIRYQVVLEGFGS